LLSWSGQLVSFGAFIWDGPEGVLNQHIFNVRPRISFELEFLEFALAYVVEVSKAKFHGIEMKHLTKEELNAQSILYPPLQLQTEFALGVRQLRGLKNRQCKQRDELDSFFNSLLQKAFWGEL
jgi:type I restriction enzyme, S subunit